MQAKDAPDFEVKAPAAPVNIINNPLIKIFNLINFDIVNKERLLMVVRKIFRVVKNNKKAQTKCIATDHGMFDLKTVNPPNKP